MIRITEKISIDEAEVKEEFVRSSGPGGQNVNKTATAVQLRFDLRKNHTLPEDVRERLIKLAGNSINKDGEILITSKRYRTQDRNRKDALDKLVNLLKQALKKPKAHRKTKPPMASKRQRLDEKKTLSRKKELRKKVTDIQE